ncbi:hypothetical protein NP493_116g01001 [Ridgeia piscesae]|uniref:non-specific serine/threonine protein kinase n=1 Tax=Ridgeia piscesae TaxID=27915 RepID=A0AAD9PGD0_RIDPI|nr:hypothetical protein NP493_116g01001 [Ridgeia piscesae]
MDARSDSPMDRGDISPGSQETGYIPVRVLGRGAFGEAVLYRKVEDNSLVVWKEVDLKCLGEKERKDSQNEIDILSILNHTNVVSYYNHFLDGDTLLIEMEYANGGSLHEKIARQKELFPEEVVLWYFYQVASAVSHIHELGILHRDIKALNIFLTKSGLVKLGDFGISKILDSNSQLVDSYVGTPYYMSPELIKGERYNQKSDIWSLGCVLYELLSLTKVFDATNPLRLASEIVHSQFDEVSPKYSSNIRTLVNNMLDKDASNRPSADDILQHTIFSDGLAESMDKKVWELDAATRRAKMSATPAAEVLPVVTSKCSEVYIWGGGRMTPQKIDMFTKGRSALQVSAGHSHLAVITVEKELYTWSNMQGGGLMVGQLGHGDTAAYKAPKKVETFENIPVRQVSCGADFTVCVTDESDVYAFGSDYDGCLGCDGDEGSEVCTPKLISFFAGTRVQQVSCGDAHVVALTEAGDVYTWGCGEFGRLGLGCEDDFALPQKVETRGKHAIKSVHAGSDGTFMIRTNGRLLACGSNEDNRLGFNSVARGLHKRKQEISYDIPYQCTFTTVKPLSKHDVASVAPGKTHTAVIDSLSRLITFGSNKFGQLGVGDYKVRSGVNIVSSLLIGKQVLNVCCGDGFTVASTSDNQVYSWGLCENGRLGTVSSDTSKKVEVPCYALPRPIFGSLHAVTDVASHHWSTILVAEKVLAQKTIGGTRVKCPDEGEDEPKMQSSQMNESSVPTWLQRVSSQ